jgi:cysteinyl-tRNA synthetase
VDLIFPHHSNEIAQSQAFSNKIPFVKYWMHLEHLMVEGEKMAKSKGNFYTLKDIKKKFNPLSFRYLCLSSHYRSKLNFTWKALESSQNALNRLYERIKELKKEGTAKKLSLRAKAYQGKFLEYINNDLDTVRALALIWKMIEAKDISNQEKYNLLLDFDKVLGLGLAKVKKLEVKKLEIPEEIKKLVEIREKYRTQKEWKKADEIRKKIKELGYWIEDTKEGPKIKKV